MITSIDDWLVFLRQADGAMGVPLIIAGAGLMLFGWRVWKICVAVTWGLVGLVAFTGLAEGNPDLQLFVLAGGFLLGLLSYWLAHYAVVLMGGVLGASVVMQMLAALHIRDTTFWLISAAVVMAACAYAHLNRRLVVIFVTAFIGAILVISGLTAFAMEFKAFYGAMRSLATGSVIVIPFLLLVPTVMSCFYQVSEIRRANADL